MVPKGERMKHATIAIIGAGNVGATTAYALMLNNIAAEILLVDVNEVRCSGETLDLCDAIPFSQTSSIRQATFQEAGQANIIVITAGIAQKPGQTRLDLLKTNIEILDSIIEKMGHIQESAIIIVVANPLDLLTQHLLNKKILPQNQIFGTGTLLDSERLKMLLAKKFDVSANEITAYVLGEHGDSQFAAWSATFINGTPIKDLHVAQSALDELAEQTKNKAYDIICCKGCTCFGIASCIAYLCRAIIFNQRLIVPVSWYHKELGVCLSLPVILGEKGIEAVHQLKLSDSEEKQLRASAQALRLLANAQ
jgi:L-lactate dehydrogenase